jgi:antitoxin HicB
VRTFAYPARFDPEDGRFTITFPDFPEGISVGDNFADAAAQAADCLDEVLLQRIAHDENIPPPSAAAADDPHGVRNILVTPPAATAAKAALYLALREVAMPQRELARRLRVDPKEARRLLDPRHRSKLPRIDEALAVLGKRITIVVDDAPGGMGRVRMPAKKQRIGRATTAAKAKPVVVTTAKKAKPVRGSRIAAVGPVPARRATARRGTKRRA